jgi:hypothetical protein
VSARARPPHEEDLWVDMTRLPWWFWAWLALGRRLVAWGWLDDTYRWIAPFWPSPPRR